jgi:uncharacterized protein YwqG
MITQNWKDAVRLFFSSITIEPAYLIMAIQIGLSSITSAELYINKVCKVNLALGEEICDNIQQHKEQQEKANLSDHFYAQLICQNTLILICSI